ncbi:RE1-silencing transcription factor isoform X2 [Carcharodon carcharias]|uniref:RE1-silencing transcription factor isoform X2 n=1 Tax=Carcharodon carcharias TaxID=13397 RepID=UPI001B7ECBF1|nr:RE1-silencing transcription factor isoform X2 [Carcharodon carcharias]
MAAQVLEQSSGTSMFSRSSVGISSDEEICGLNYLSKNDLTAAPQLVMLANVALTGDISCYDYHGEDRQMAELKTVNDNLSDNEDDLRTDMNDALQSESLSAENSVLSSSATKDSSESSSQDTCDSGTDSTEVVNQESLADKGKKSKPFRCRPCQYEAESEVEFVHHIKVHSAKKFIVEENAEKQTKSKVPDPLPEETDISKGPIRCDRCGYNTNRYDHYLAHLKHHDKVGENEKVYKCTICTYTTVSEYHWKKHLRNHFPRKVYTCSQCSYFSDRKNNYVQHMRTHTGERPYKCPQCPYSSSQKTHLTRHMRTHSGEKPFKCDQCNYVASNQHEVTRHARQVHNGPKPLTCPHCEYRTADRSNFKKHVELHVNPRQFLCPVCKYAASKKCNLQYHIKSKHPHCSDITMDVSKVKLRTKRIELDIPIGKLGKKMSDKLQLKRAENPEEVTAKPEKSTSVSKERGFSSKSQRMKTRNHKVFNKLPSRKRETNAEKVRKIKSSKRKRCSTDVSLQQKPVVETHTEVKRRKIWKAKELVERETQRSRIKLDKSSCKKNLKCKQRKKKNKKCKKACVLSADDPYKGKKSDQPEHQLSLSKKKRDYSRSSSCSNPNAEGVHKRDAQGSEPFLDIVMTEIPLGTVVEKNDLDSTRSACEMVQMTTRESQTLPYQLTVTKSEEQMLTKKMINKSYELLCVEEPSVTCTEQTGVPAHSSGKTEHTSYSPKTSIDLNNSEAKEMCEETCLLSEVEPERSVQVINIELPNSNNPNKDQGCIGEEMEVQGDLSKQMEVQGDLSKQMEVQGDLSKQAEVQGDLSKQAEVQGDLSKQTEVQGDLSKQTEVQGDLSKQTEVQGDLSKQMEVQGDLTEQMEIQGDLSEQMEVQGNVNEQGEVQDNVNEQVELQDDLNKQVEAQDIMNEHVEVQDDLNEQVEVQMEDKQIKLEDYNKVLDDQNKVQDSADEIQVGKTNQDRLLYDDDKVRNSKHDQNKKQDKDEMGEIDEDEGIHSHEGSDISEDSEGSDDSGLNGAKSTPDDKTNKRTLEEDVIDAPESFVCIFCDRIFSVKGEFTKHLNRHLVNVYYLEEAAKGQE